MFLTKYFKLIWSGVLFLAGVLVTFLTTNSLKNRKEKKRVTRQYERAKEVMEQDAEIDRQLDVRTEEIANEIEDKKSTSELSDPDKW
jgi:hypothetical protein